MGLFDEIKHDLLTVPSKEENLEDETPEEN